jgi:hypothetical protein
MLAILLVFAVAHSGLAYLRPYGGSGQLSFCSCPVNPFCLTAAVGGPHALLDCVRDLLVAGRLPLLPSAAGS